MKIYVDPAADMHYASFYMEGIRRMTGKMPTFSSRYFKPFRHNNHFFALVVVHKGQTAKAIIDFADTSKIDQDAYRWCDVYAKINIDFADDVKYDKLVSIAPSFGIHVLSNVATVWFSIRNFIKAKDRIANPRRFFSDYNAQRKRLSIGHYRKAIATRHGYIFFASSLWKAEPQTNAFRANFIRAAQSCLGKNFEGGFAPRKKNDVPGFEDLTLMGRVSVSEYFEKVKASMVVFNTPAVLHCHGWKLGEFLTMGKAIISTPISRKLPRAFVDGEDFLLTDGTQADLEHKIQRLADDPQLRQKLERASEAYYQTFVAPEKVMALLFDRLGIR